jgi:hypothetical protein
MLFGLRMKNWKCSEMKVNRVVGNISDKIVILDPESSYGNCFMNQISCGYRTTSAG